MIKFHLKIALMTLEYVFPQTANGKGHFLACMLGLGQEYQTTMAGSYYFPLHYATGMNPVAGKALSTTPSIVVESSDVAPQES